MISSFPLQGKTVLVTRASSQASSLRVLLEEKGASVIEFPVIAILPPSDWTEVDRAIENWARFDWIIFTSVNGVHFFFKRLRELGKDARIFSGKKIAVIGEATKHELESYGLSPDLVPEDFTSEGLIEKLKDENIHGKHFLLARTDIAPDYLRKALENRGAVVQEVAVYRTVAAGVGQKKQLEKIAGERKIDFVTFTSSSTVKNFLEGLSPKLRRQMKSKLVSIGPVTSRTLREYGLKPYREAKRHTIPGLVEAMLPSRHCEEAEGRRSNL